MKRRRSEENISRVYFDTIKQTKECSLSDSFWSARKLDCAMTSCSHLRNNCELVKKNLWARNDEYELSPAEVVTSLKLLK